MSHFRGRFDYTVDEKGRVNIPAKFRKALNPAAAETFIVCRGVDNSLRVFPLDTWEKFEEEISSRPETPETVKYKRLLYSTVTDSMLDAQGRISLSPSQIEIASIKKNVTLVGMNSSIEIWDTDRYNNHIKNSGDFDQSQYQSIQSDVRKLAPQQ
jgi:MraZ protein